MNTNDSSRGLRRKLLSLALTSLVPILAQAADGNSPPSTANRGAYTLFTGAHIEALHNGVHKRAQNVENGAFVIVDGGQAVLIPLKSSSTETLKIIKSQELTDRWATVTNLKHERDYTPANNPHRRFNLDVEAMQMADSTVTRAEVIEARTPAMIRHRDIVTGVEKFIPNADHASAVATVQQARASAGNTMSHLTQKLADELALELFDALEVEFEVAADKPIQNPYVVVTAKLRERDSVREGRNWLFAKKLAPIGTTPVKVVMRDVDLPLGFKVENLEVHLYENGSEIATNLSENRAPLTREEAHEYLVLTYVSMNGSATLPPKLALTDLPEDWKSRRNDGSLQRAYHVKVDENGRATGVYEDEKCTTRAADSYGVELLGRQCYFPALRSGKPVEGVARVLPVGLPM